MSTKTITVKRPAKRVTAKKANKTRLEIKPREFRKNLFSMLAELDEKKKIEAFVKSPTKFITGKVLKRNLSPQRESESNRLMYSLFANDNMVKWIRTYNKKHKGKKIPQKQFAMDFAKAIAKYGDENIMVSLISNVAKGFGIPGLTDNFFICLINDTSDPTSFACTPVDNTTNAETNPEIRQLINPERLRAITHHLNIHAKRLSKAGKLSNLNSMIH